MRRGARHGVSARRRVRARRPLLRRVPHRQPVEREDRRLGAGTARRARDRRVVLLETEGGADRCRQLRRSRSGANAEEPRSYDLAGAAAGRVARADAVVRHVQLRDRRRRGVHARGRLRRTGGRRRHPQTCPAQRTTSDARRRHPAVARSPPEGRVALESDLPADVPQAARAAGARATDAQERARLHDGGARRLRRESGGEGERTNGGAGRRQGEDAVAPLPHAAANRRRQAGRRSGRPARVLRQRERLLLRHRRLHGARLRFYPDGGDYDAQRSLRDVRRSDRSSQRLQSGDDWRRLHGHIRSADAHAPRACEARRVDGARPARGGRRLPNTSPTGSDITASLGHSQRTDCRRNCRREGQLRDDFNDVLKARSHRHRETRNEERETRNEKSDGAVTLPPRNEKR